MMMKSELLLIRVTVLHANVMFHVLHVLSLRYMIAFRADRSRLNEGF